MPRKEKPMQSRRIVTSTILATLLGTTALAAVETYHFGVSDQRTNITFESQTDFEIILGSSHKVSGSVVTDLEKGTAKIELYVPVASLRTGIDLRDEHLRSAMWLDAGKYPTLSFVSKSARKLAADRWEVRGTFTMRGVSREISTTVQVRLIPASIAKKAGLEKGQWMKVSTSFPVSLSDFGVEVPDMLGARVNDVWSVRLLAYASTVSPVHAVNP